MILNLRTHHRKMFSVLLLFSLYTCKCVCIIYMCAIILHVALIFSIHNSIALESKFRIADLKLRHAITLSSSQCHINIKTTQHWFKPHRALAWDFGFKIGYNYFRIKCTTAYIHSYMHCKYIPLHVSKLFHLLKDLRF